MATNKYARRNGITTGVVRNTGVTETSIISEAIIRKEQDHWRYRLGSFLASRLGESTILVLIVMYMIIVSINIAVGKNLSDVNFYLNILELVIASIFVIEITIKISVFCGSFCRDIWNIFDSIIVITTFILWLINIIENDIETDYLRFIWILRILRVIASYRKILVNQNSIFKKRGSGKNK